MSAALTVAGVGKSFGAFRALHEVSFEVKEGEIVAVIGPNGAGKTTLLSIVAGAQAASSGTVAPAAREVGWVPQQPALYSKLSVAENLELFARLERSPDPLADVARMLDQTGLRERAGDRVEVLSGGNRQRVNVALGLLGEPRVLALDEPTTALDPGQRERLWDFLVGLRDGGGTVIFSSHNVAEVQRHATRAIVLADGQLVFDGAPAALLAAGGEPAGGDLERALVAFLAAGPPAPQEAQP